MSRYAFKFSCVCTLTPCYVAKYLLACAQRVHARLMYFLSTNLHINGATKPSKPWSKSLVFLKELRDATRMLLLQLCLRTHRLRLRAGIVCVHAYAGLRTAVFCLHGVLIAFPLPKMKKYVLNVAQMCIGYWLKKAIPRPRPKSESLFTSG
jgi:hypothetical protein